MACNLGAEVTFRGSRLSTSLQSTPIVSGRRPIQVQPKSRKVDTLHAVELAPAPLQSILGTTFDACGTSLLERAWWLLLLLQSHRQSGRRPRFQCCWYSSSSHGIGSFHALHTAAMRRWANRLHVGDSRHLVMSPSEALAKLLTNDDHCCYGLVLHL